MKTLTVPESEHRADAPLAYRWAMLALVWLAYATFGLATRTVAPLVTPIMRDLGISNTQMGAILGSWQAAYIVFAVFAGVILDRWGVRKAILFGGLIIALSLIVRYWVDSFVPLFLGVALLGVGGPLISIGSPKMVSAWFDSRERGIAVGIYATGPIVGSLIALSATHPIVMPLAGGSWRTAFVIYGILALIVTSLWAVASREPQRRSREHMERPSVVLATLLRLRDVRILLAMGVCSFAVIHGFGNWLPKFLEMSGLSQGGAGFLASLPLLTGLVSAMVIPRIVSSQYRAHAMSICAALTAGLLVAIPHITGPPLVVALASIGATSGSFLPLEMLMLMQVPAVQARVMGSAGGIFFCFAEIGGVGGPLLIGMLSDATGSFSSGMYFLASVAILIVFFALGSSWSLRSRREPC